MELQKQIQNLITGDAVDDHETLQTFSKDASLYKIEPQVVVFPKQVSDIQALIKFVAEKKRAGFEMSISTRAAGTDMTGGPLTESIVIATTRYLNHIKKIGRDYAITEPGVYYRDFEKRTLEQGLILPSYPASRELCAIGGIVANNSGGELNLNYGKTENYVQEIKMVLADGLEAVFRPLNLAELEQKKLAPGLEGQIYRQMSDLIDYNYELLQQAKPKVSKNSAGYYLWNVFDKAKGIFDLTKLIVGSQGTLGVISEVNLKLVKPKKHEHLLVIFLKDLHDIPQIVNLLLPFQPQSIESYDDQTFKVAMRLLPNILARLKGNALKLLWGFLPELWMTLTGGIPKLVLLVEFAADSDAEAMRTTQKAQESLLKLGLATKLIKTEDEAQKYWVIRRESFNLLRHHVQGMRTAPFIDDFVVKPEVLGEFLPELYQILDKYKLLYTIAGHVGDGNFHIIPLMKLGDKNAPVIISKLGAEVYELVFKYHGSMTGEHNDGLVRGPYLKQMYGEQVFDLFVQTKKIWDPEGIFNPHKKSGADFDYAKKHLDF